MNNEFLLNMKSIPWKEDGKYFNCSGEDEYNTFWAIERDKCEYGLTVNGVRIPGWLYWHTQLWHIYQNIQDPINHIIKRVSMQASFRDNEWIIAEAIEQAELEKKGVMIFGSRRLGKSEVIASYLGQGATLYQGTENVVMGGNWGDIDVVMSKVVHGLNNLPEYFKFGRLSENLRKEIELGFKTKKGVRESWSKIICRNHENGIKTESPAGLTPSRFIMDEIAKALKNDSILYTEDGLIQIGNAKVGDKIYGADGKLTTILGVYPQGKKELYTIILDDSREITCCLDHLWEIYDNRCKQTKIVDTKYLLDNLYSKNKVKKKKFFIKVNQPLQFDKKDLKVDPYLLGVWLGDGNKTDTSFTSIDSDIVDEVNRIANKYNLYVRSKEKHHNIRNISNKKTNYLKEQFKNYSLLHNKHIPEVYLRSSIDDRLSLLQGLMDTDGTVTKNGSISFTQKKGLLSDNFEFLCRSLGISLKKKVFISSYKNKNGEKIKTSEAVKYTLYTDLQVFRLKRKVDRLNSFFENKKHRCYVEKNGIIDIKYYGEDYATCIKVDNKDSLFLTDNFVVTHNSKFSEVLDAAKPAFTSEYGWRCSPILTGTSGDIKSTADAKSYFDNPDAHNFIVRYIPEEGNRKSSVFISGMYRMEGKNDSSIGNYVESEKGIILPKDSELFNVPMKVKDNVKALNIIEEERKAAEKSPDPSALLKQKMYYPLDSQELFLSDDGNNFPKEAIQEQIAFLEANPHLQGETCELYRDTDGKVQFNFNTQKKPLLEFPLEKSKFNEYKKDAPIIIYERPSDNITYFLNIAGLDSYNMSSSAWSDSLGSLFIFKRFYDPIGGSFQRRIVAEYTARPESMKIFHDNCVMLLEAYNATCMIENEAQTTIQYFDLNNKGLLLADGFSLLKEIHPTTSIIGRTKGLPATKPVQKHYKELIYQYLTEEVILDFDKEHNPIKKLGVIRINSIGLLKELLHYNDEGNFDRYVAFGHTLTYETWADKLYPLTIEDTPIESPKKQSHIRSPFSTGNTNPFGSFNRGRNPFGL